MTLGIMSFILESFRYFYALLDSNSTPVTVVLRFPLTSISCNGWPRMVDSESLSLQQLVSKASWYVTWSELISLALSCSAEWHTVRNSLEEIYFVFFKHLHFEQIITYYINGTQREPFYNIWLLTFQRPCSRRGRSDWSICGIKLSDFLFGLAATTATAMSMKT